MPRLPTRVRPLRPAALAFAAALALAVAAGAADWPQWRGPQRNGISGETGIAWPAGGPRQLWKVEVGQGLSGVAVRGGRVYTVGNDGRQDTVWCLDGATGRPTWKYSYPCGPGDYEGPRATPTLDGDRVYTLSREGHALCLNAGTGALVWRKDLGREFGPSQPRWGFAGSPLVQGGRVFYNVGSAGTALDKATGKVQWFSGTRTAGYAAPVAYTLGGKAGIAFFVAWGVVGVDGGTGKPQWQFPWSTPHDVNAADPIIAGDSVFVSSNYNTGCGLFRIAGGRGTPVWQNRNMRNHFNSCVLLNGALYGNDENTLKCLDLRTGAERWRSRGIDKGGVLAADGKLIVLTGRGELLLVSATPAAYTELGRARVLDGETWTPPALADGRVYCRSRQGQLACLDLRAK